MTTPATVARDRLIVALDVPSVEAARALIGRLGDSVGVYKIGLELLFSGGFALADALARQNAKVFLDAKLLDIEATVERATAAIAKTGASFLTVHAADSKTLKAAVRGRGDSALKLLGVTVLTNLEAADLVQQGTDIPPAELVLHRAMLAKEAGFDGVVASGQEAASIRAAVGPKFLIVTPGIRPAGSAAGDQARVVPPASAIEAGADYLVVGRPITGAPDPRAAALAIAEEMAGAIRARG
jgi:orotidine-5'-phosphate decarboxylase